VAAPLAPTVETGPQNLADHLYLQQLYEEGAAAPSTWRPASPTASTPARRPHVANDTLNFSRLILLREVMERNGDGGKALWAGNWGWNSLPAGWSGAPSVWGQVTPNSRPTGPRRPATRPPNGPGPACSSWKTGNRPPRQTMRGGGLV
jgi:hypothetical protein